MVSKRFVNVRSEPSKVNRAETPATSIITFGDYQFIELPGLEKPISGCRKVYAGVGFEFAPEAPTDGWAFTYNMYDRGMVDFFWFTEEPVIPSMKGDLLTMARRSIAKFRFANYGWFTPTWGHLYEGWPYR